MYLLSFLNVESKLEKKEQRDLHPVRVYSYYTTIILERICFAFISVGSIISDEIDRTNFVYWVFRISIFTALLPQ